jgi:hypothetical protein
MDPKNSRTDVRALGEVMEQLMEDKAGYPTNWSFEAFDFLTLTKTKSAEQLSTVSNPISSPFEDALMM